MAKLLITVQQRLEPLEHALDAPALAVQPHDADRVDVGAIAPRHDGPVTRLGGRVQFDFDAPPYRALRCCGAVHKLDGLLPYSAGLDGLVFAPGT